jgi:hypothetical protein
MHFGESAENSYPAFGASGHFQLRNTGYAVCAVGAHRPNAIILHTVKERLQYVKWANLRLFSSPLPPFDVLGPPLHSLL